MNITLAPHEMAIAAWVGVRRNIESRRRGLPDKHGLSGEGWNEHIEGAGGELAVAKMLNLYWDGSINTFKRADLAGVQVRTRSHHGYDLLVRPDDSPEDAFVHVTGRMPHYRIHGWMTGAEAMQDRWMAHHGDRPAAYFVPRSELRPIQTLRQTTTEAA